MDKNAVENENGLKPYLSPIHIWALSVGSAIGWGCLIVTNGTYLAQAGPAGSILGLIIGFLMMLMVANHYTFLAKRYPGTGGLYNYIKFVFGYDRAFLVAWFMFLIYIAIFWANATSVPLFARFFIGDLFQFGYLYTIFGYEVYIGEALLTIVAIIAIGYLCMNSKKAAANTMVVMVITFTVGITVCFAAAMILRGGHYSGSLMDPAFIPDKNVIEQVIRIGFLSPWAFIGFESVSHSASEIKFPYSKIFRVMLVALAVTTALYIFVILMSISCYPPECTSWLDYISRLDEFEGLAGLPAFYAANYYLGDFGVILLMASLLCLVLSSLIGMLRTVGRLCYAVAQDGILPKRFAELNEKQIPVNTILLTVLISLPVAFLGRTAIGWIVDTTTIGATILYGFVSVAVFKVVKVEGAHKHKKDHFLSGICLFILVAFMIFLLFPTFFSDHTIETETYVLMSIWSMIGLVFFNRVIKNDHARHFGKAIIVWIALLAFIVIMSMTWSERMNEDREDVVMEEVREYYGGTAAEELQSMDEDEFIALERQKLHDADNGSVAIILVLFTASLGAMVVNFLSMQKWEKKTAAERDEARVAANTDSLTGVKSKHAFAVAEGHMEERIVEGVCESFGVIVCDVNGLKKINDTLGHKAGDQYIRSACEMLCEFFKHSPVFRVGGDEFVVLLEGRDYFDRHIIMSKINQQIEDNLKNGKVVASLGLAEFEKGKDESFHEVFKRADELMYKRKLQLKSMGAATRD